MKYIRKKRNKALNEIADPTLGGVSYTVQRNPGYTYQILPLTHDLEQKPNKVHNEYYIYPGCRVRGVGLKHPELHFTGKVHRIVKDENGVIRFIYIQSEKTNKMVTILADENLELLIPRTNPGISQNSSDGRFYSTYAASKI